MDEKWHIICFELSMNLRWGALVAIRVICKVLWNHLEFEESIMDFALIYSYQYFFTPNGGKVWKSLIIYH